MLDELRYHSCEHAKKEIIDIIIYTDKDKNIFEVATVWVTNGGLSINHCYHLWLVPPELHYKGSKQIG